MNRLHHYEIKVNWTGNTGKGTKDYKAYSRNHDINSPGKPTINASSDPSFLGDKNRYNPEELFLAALSSCHMLWYLHLCAEAGVVVVSYTDAATGTMEENENGGVFTGVALHPEVIVTEKSMLEKASALHHAANAKCYIANSCNFSVKHNPVTLLSNP